MHQPKLLALSLALVVSLVSAVPTFAQIEPAPSGAPQGAPPGAPQGESDISTNAQFAAIVDYDTGTLLFSKSANEQMIPASMAKLITVAIMFHKLKHAELKLDDTFTVSEKAWRLSVVGKNESSKMFLSIGSQVRVEDLLRGIIIQSGNDACTVVAEHFSGSEEAFAEFMNAEAKRIGMTNSVFKNANGLPHPDMHVTAHDLAILAAYLIREYPEYYHYFSEREFTWNKIKQGNRNLLLGTYPGVDGLKTGHTAESGYGMVASALVEGRRLIVVVNGLKSDAERAAEAKRLLDIGFREFKPYNLFSKNQVIEKAEVWAGDGDSVALVAAQDVKVLMRRSQRDTMKVVLSYDSPLVAPVKAGQRVGKLKITVAGLPDIEVPVAAGGDVEEGGFMTQIKLGVKGLISSSPESAPVSKDVSMTDTPSQAAQVHE
ncbi:MAG: D-alanyl-D-alanine carboxypeptidase family protein [Micropepsaceae bacterium]